MTFLFLFILKKKAYLSFSIIFIAFQPRQGYRGSPIKEKFRTNKEKTKSSPTPSEFRQIKATFSNSGKDEGMKNAKLYFQDQFWSDIGFDDSSSKVNTYEGHVWNVQVDGKVVKSWSITEKKGLHQEFSV